ncbi:cytochrome P450 [Streptomyces sp. NBC_01104]|uniref:cytochrome P450 n=1 Tax=Streptomyces sp. NBC_01104 TaxID=2903750 RepID=UPI00386BDE72|nr:cytochrome P450 [Streptomyces sp. NBC_01104]
MPESSDPEITEFFLPELPRLLPYVYHPQAAKLEIASNGWVRRQLGDTFAGEEDLLYFLRQRNGIYGPLTVPEATDQRALDIADWYQYVTVIDSFVSDRSALGASADAARAVFARILGDFDTDVEADEAFPYGRAGQDLWRRISPGLSPAQIGRFGASLEAFLRGCATEIHAKLTDRVPDYEDCLTVRLESFGCDFIELMTEYGAEVDMTELIPEFTEVHLHCRRQMIIINDLLSWRKEHAQDDKMTVVRVLTEGEGLSLQQAVDRLCDLVEEHEKAYIAARDEILGGALGEREDVRRYLRGLDHLMGGSQEFEYLTPRYFGDGSVWDGTTSGWVDLNAEVTRFRDRPHTPAEDADGAGTAGPGDTGHATAPEPEGVNAVAEDAAPDSGAAAARPTADDRAAIARLRSIVSPGTERRSGGDGQEPDASEAGGPGRRPARGATRTEPWKVVTAPGALPVLGHALPLWRRPLEFLGGLPTDADLVEIRLGPKKAYLAHSPELAQQVLTDSRTFDKGGPLFEKARLLVGNGLVSSEWAPHKRQRRLLQPAFHPSRVPGYIGLMGEELEEELAAWEPGKALDVSDTMHGLTLKITARTMFATTADRRAIDEVAYCMPVIMRGVYKRMIAPTGLQEKLPTAHNRDFEQVRVRMRRLIRETVEAYRTGDSEDTGDLMSILVNTRDEETGEGLSDEEIHDQVMTLLIGGTETTGNTMAWVFHTLATHPHIEERLHEELDTVLAGRVPGFGDLHRLPYTGRVITETLRMYPPAWLLTRATTRATELAGRSIDAGTIVLYSPYALGHNPAIYADPDTFDPDRWLPERAEGLPRGFNLPFGGGSRKCIGDTLGAAETTITLAGIAARWRLRTVPGTKAGTAVPRASLGTGPLPMVPERRDRVSGPAGLTLSSAR